MVPHVVVVPEPGQFLHVQVEQVGGERSPQQGRGVVLRSVQAQGRRRRRWSAAASARVEDVVRAEFDAGDLELSERLGDGLALGAGAGPARRSGRPRGAPFRSCRQRPAPLCLRGRGRSAGRSRPPLAGPLSGPGPDLLRFSPGRFGIRTNWNGVGSSSAVFDDQLGALARGRPGRLERELRQQERSRAGEQFADGADQPRRRPVVVFQPERFSRRAKPVLGLQVGEDVGAAEAVDRLLRVADDEQPAVRGGAVAPGRSF